MALPRAVKKQVDEANRIVAELTKGEAPDEAPKPELQVVEPPAEEPPAEHGAPPPVEEPPVEEPAAEQQAPEVVEPPVEEPPKKDFEHMYNVLQGKYNTEVPALHQQVGGLQSRLDQLEGLLAAQNEPAPAPAQSTLITDEERSDYGEDLLDVMGRKAKEVLGTDLANVLARLEKIEGSVGSVASTVGKNEKETFFAKLDGAVEDWRNINERADFVEWLNQPDAYSGIVRGKLLNKAYEENDATRAIAFFKGFLNEHAAVTPPASTGSDNSGTPPKADMSKFVAPGQTKSGTVGAQKQGRVWTQPEIKAFYRDVAAGKFKGRDDEKVKIEREIIKSISGGVKP